MRKRILDKSIDPRIQFCIDLKTQEYKTCEVDLRVSIAWKDGIFFSNKNLSGLSLLNYLVGMILQSFVIP